MHISYDETKPMLIKSKYCTIEIRNLCRELRQPQSYRVYWIYL